MDTPTTIRILRVIPVQPTVGIGEALVRPTPSAPFHVEAPATIIAQPPVTIRAARFSDGPAGSGTIGGVPSRLTLVARSDGPDGTAGGGDGPSFSTVLEQHIRTFVVDTLTSRTVRQADIEPLKEWTSVVFVVAIDTGEISEIPRHGAPPIPAGSVACCLVIHPQTRIMGFPEAEAMVLTKKLGSGSLTPLQTAQGRLLLQILQRMNGQTIASPRAEVPEKTPAINDPERMAAMEAQLHDFIHDRSGQARPMTLKHKPHAMTFPPMLVGTLWLDADGRFVASNLAYPAAINPHGTTYHHGLSSETAVRVVMTKETEEPLLLDCSIDKATLSARQTATLRAFLRHQADRRERFLAQHPSTIDFAIGTEVPDWCNQLDDLEHKADRQHPDTPVAFDAMVVRTRKGTYQIQSPDERVPPGAREAARVRIESERYLAILRFTATRISGDIPETLDRLLQTLHNNANVLRQQLGTPQDLRRKTKRRWFLDRMRPARLWARFLRWASREK